MSKPTPDGALVSLRGISKHFGEGDYDKTEAAIQRLLAAR